MKKKETYQDLLKDQRWIKKRNEILARDKNTCQFCGAQNRYLHIHHKKYEKGMKPWEYANDDLITLCDRCHENVTNDSRELYQNFLYLRDSMRTFGFSDAVICTLLERLGAFYELCEEEEPLCKKEIVAITDMAVFGAINYNDLRVLKKLGVDHTNYIECFMPQFIDDYKKVED